jgi:iron complex transport system permease protein
VTTIDFGLRQWTIRVGGYSARWAVRSTVVVTGLVTGAIVVAILALGLGEYVVSPLDVIRVFTGANTSFDQVVVLEWRAPRVAMALLVGAALAVSGAIFQALTRNPLGSPDIIGLDFGAYTGALVVIAAFGGGYYATAAGALIGGLSYAALLYALAYRKGVAGYRLIVVGIALGAMVSSVNQWISIKINLHAAVTAAVWQQGSLNGLSWAQAIPMALCLAVLAALLIGMGLRLPVVQMGDDIAGALGIRPERARLCYLAAAVGLVALATAAAGPISFVALAAPQLARRLTRGAGVSLTSSAAMGSALLVTSDLIAQHLFGGHELPVGAVTVSLGGLYLVYLLTIQNRRG